MGKTRIAQCSCGGLTVTTTDEPALIVVCHCIACQRRTGSPFGAGAYFQREHATIDGETSQYARTVEGSERTLTNYFCPNCGNTVYWTLDLRPNHIGLAVGNFGNPQFGFPTRTVWTQHKHHWVTLPADIPAFPQAST